ncbi:unnamed protein product [Ectocarpus sp. CCAP 1310/34]|nr:unnamed protein product [Ectocarpus sp. CCAP 1310/34]
MDGDADSVLLLLQAVIIKAVVAARSELHGDVRGALVDFLIPMIEEEAATNNPRTAADLLRGVREQVADIDPAAEAINTLLHRVMWRYTKTHMQSTREDLSEGQLVGEDRLHEDFLAQVTHCSRLVCRLCRGILRELRYATPLTL